VPDRVRAYYDAESFASWWLKKRRGWDFGTTCLSVGAIDEALSPLVPAATAADGISRSGSIADEPGHQPTTTMEATVIDLAGILQGLRAPESEKFLVPDRIYVRESMRQVFDLFRKDAATKKRPPNSTVLLGSPGVGKSILFFLAALHQAARGLRVVYYRRTTRNHEADSLFIMSPSPQGGVRIWFTRRLDAGAEGGIRGLHESFRRYQVVTEQHVIYVDGPRYDDEPNTLSGRYDYFCTSGGMPPPKNADRGRRMWILDGWMREETVACLTQVHNKSHEEAREAFRLCGGNIRDLIDVCGAKVKLGEKRDELDDLLKSLSDRAVQLALRSSLRQDDVASPDRLRTMFWGRSEQGDYKKRMCALQIVDSEYVLDHLRRRHDVGGILGAFKEAVTLSPNRTLQGCYFELLIHQFIEKSHNLSSTDAPSTLPPVNEVVWSNESTWDGDLLKLSRSNQYWIPRTQNFRNVDSALVNNGTLYSFQITIKSSHSFTESTFRKDFETVRERLQFSDAIHYFLHPHDTAFNFPDILKPPGTRSQHQGTSREASLPIKFKSLAVDVTSIETLTRSMMALFHGIGGSTLPSPRRRKRLLLQVLDEDIAQEALSRQLERETERQEGQNAHQAGHEGPRNAN
jgi:hypothetical protein